MQRSAVLLGSNILSVVRLDAACSHRHVLIF